MEALGKELFKACGLDGKPDVEKLQELLKRDDIQLNEAGINNDLTFVTPLEVACRDGYLEIVETLMGDPRVKMSTLNLVGVTIFETACINGQVEVVKYLLMNERTITDFTQSKSNPLLDSCRLKYFDIGKWILASGRIIPNEIIESTKNLFHKKEKDSAVSDFVQLLEKFLLDPIQTRKELRKELGLPGLIFFFQKN